VRYETLARLSCHLHRMLFDRIRSIGATHDAMLTNNGGGTLILASTAVQICVARECQLHRQAGLLRLRHALGGPTDTVDNTQTSGSGDITRAATTTPSQSHHLCEANTPGRSSKRLRQLIARATRLA
jgi:hypothetical protein